MDYKQLDATALQVKKLMDKFQKAIDYNPDVFVSAHTFTLVKRSELKEPHFFSLAGFCVKRTHSILYNYLCQYLYTEDYLDIVDSEHAAVPMPVKSDPSFSVARTQLADRVVELEHENENLQRMLTVLERRHKVIESERKLNDEQLHTFYYTQRTLRVDVDENGEFVLKPTN